MKQPAKKDITRGYFKLVNGVWCKRCTGAAHDGPVWLPANDKYFYSRKSGVRAGQLLHRCRLCTNWEQNGIRQHIGLVPVRQVHEFYIEAAARVGVAELARRTGLTYQALVPVLEKRVQTVRKENARKVLLELISMRRKNEHSIHSSARWRIERRLHGVVERCAECGTPFSNFTEGCKLCTNRRLRHKDTEAAA